MKNNCLCQKLKKIKQGTYINLVLKNIKLTIKFKKVKNDRIYGFTLDKEPISFSCNHLIGFTVKGNLSDDFLTPGTNYDLNNILPNKMIKSISVKWQDVGTNATGTLYIDDIAYETKNVPDSLQTSTWENLNINTDSSTLIKVEINNGYVEITNKYIIYQ